MSAIKRLATLILAALLCLICVSCDLDYKASSTSVSFETVSKAINQSGSAQSQSTNVNEYYWTYYAGKTAPTDDSEFHLFESLKNSDNSYNRGIGVISDLEKGQSYYFALKAFFNFNNNSGAAEELRWFGCSELTKIVSATTPVKVELEAAGNGSCRFEISAPADVDGAKSYRFQIKLYSLDSTTELQKEITGTTSLADSKVSFVSDEIALEAGCYRAVIKEQSSADGNIYRDINNRAQIILVQVNSGVITTVKGTLDSTKEAN